MNCVRYWSAGSVLKIGTAELQGHVIAAPLAGISNPVYRQVNHDAGAALTVSEMISDKALHYHNAKTFDMCRVYETEHPVSLQLFGGDPETMAEAAEYLTEHTACDIIDINMGCPVPKVLKSHAGSYLMSDPDLAVRIAEAVVRHTDRPVTVKMRAGYDKEHINAPELAKRLEDIGVAAIAVHGRTKTQLYRGVSDNRYIRMVKEAVSIPVFGNGDIRTCADAERMFEETGCDAVMIGRGLVGKPYLIRQIEDHLAGRPYTEPGYEERTALCIAYAEKLCAYEGERTGVSMMRGLVSYYLDGMPYAARVRAECAKAESLDGLRQTLEEYREKLRRMKEPDGETGDQAGR